MPRTSTAAATRTASAADRHQPGDSCPQPGRWIIDGDRSTLQVSVKVGLFTTVHGRFGEVSGELEVADEPTDSRVDVTVPTTSLTSGSHCMDALLHGAGVIDSAANPVITFISHALRPGVAAGSWLLDGLLATAGAVLEVTLTMADPQVAADGSLRLRATGSLPSREAVRLLSHPGVERLLGKTMGLDLTVVAIRVD